MEHLNEKTKGYLNGDFDYDGGSLIFSCAKIEISLHEGEVVDGSFSIEEQSGKEMEGDIYTSHIRMSCKQEHFSGTQIQIDYQFNSEGMEAGDVVKGNFSIVSDRGEYIISFVAMVLYEHMETSLGSIKNLFHFTNLAKSNWEEAVKLFSQTNFEDVLTGNDSKYINLYHGLSRQGEKNRNLEEFLIGINKKQKIEYVAEHSSIKIDNPQGIVSHVVKIERNGWGYTHLNVKADGSFLTVEKNQLSDNDFLGNSCHYTFYVNEENLHEGKNFGRLIFRHMYGSFEVVIQVNRNSFGKISLTGHKRKSITYAIIRHFLDFRMKKINMSKWLLLTGELIGHRKNIDEENVENSLFEAHLLITQERFNEAKWILDYQVAPIEEELSDTLYCYYLYLTTLYNVDEFYTREMTEKVFTIFEKNNSDWRIAWLLLSLSEDLNRNPAKKWAFALKQISAGCCSPIFYLELIRIINAMPSLLNRIQEEEKRVLLFGAKEDILSDDLIQQIAYLALRQKNYDEGIFRILSLLYKKKPSDEILQAVCTLLMKGSKIGVQYFSWYEQAVNKNFPITRLYDYYMMSMDLRGERQIPKRVLMYFSYQNELTVSRSAYLYAFMVRNREKYSDIYVSYHEQIGRFLLKQLYAGKIDRNLAFLYQEIIFKEMLTPDNAQQLAKLLYVHSIYVKNSQIVNVVILDERMQIEKKYPVNNGVAYVALPGNEYTLLLEDIGGNRFFQTLEYNTERFFLPRKLLPILEKYAEDNLLFNLFMCEENRELIYITEQNVNRYRYLEQSDEIMPSYKKAVRMQLILHWFEKDNGLLLDEILERIESDDILRKDRIELVRLLVIRGFYQKAFDFALKYGAENIEAKVLVRVAAELLENEGFVESKEMTYLIFSAFERGKYNETVLTYLVRFYKGMAKNLRNIWRAASNFCVDTYSICETMMLQTISTGAFIGDEIAVLKQYVNGGAKADVEMAYLSYCAFEFFIHDRVVDEYVFYEMERLYTIENELPQVCMLAFLKFQSEKTDSLSEQTKQIIIEFLRILYVKKHIMMPFFVNFREFSMEAMELTNLSIVEYKGNPNSTVVLHYVISREQDETVGYIKEEMTNMYGGIFVKAFLLFFGETLQYYITEEYANKEQLTESGTIQKSDATGVILEDRFNTVNDIAIADILKDYDTSFDLLKEYDYKKYLVDHIFMPQ